jgi:hypothetical protein
MHNKKYRNKRDYFEGLLILNIDLKVLDYQNLLFKKQVIYNLILYYFDRYYIIILATRICLPDYVVFHHILLHCLFPMVYIPISIFCDLYHEKTLHDLLYL